MQEIERAHAGIPLCIPGLHELTSSMSSGGLYALLTQKPPSRFPILASTLGGALRSGVPCTVILASQPEEFIERISAFWEFDALQAIRSGELNVFLQKERFAVSMFRYGAERFTQELEQFQIPPNSYLLFDQADELFSTHDVVLAIAQATALKAWFRERRITALLVFSRLTSMANEVLNVMMDQLSGIARLRSGRDGLELSFDYWQSATGMISAKHYPRVLTLESGLYDVTPVPETAQPRILDEAALDGPHRYFYMDQELGSLEQQIPGVWQHVGSLVGMLHASLRYPTATIILSFQQDTGLRQIAETVHTLRYSLGRRASIVVRESEASLRYQNEALLLRLGVSLVIHRDVAQNRFPLLLQSLSGQSFERDIDVNFEVALASALPSGVCGYLPAERFSRETNDIIERGAVLNIPGALVIGKPAQGRTVEDVLKRFTIARKGDLITSDGTLCYLYLNGCPESAVLATIERLAGEPVNAAFEESRFIVQRAEIKAELALLTGAAQRLGLPDYSSLYQPTAPSARQQQMGQEALSILTADTSANYSESRDPRLSEGNNISHFPTRIVPERTAQGLPADRVSPEENATPATATDASPRPTSGEQLGKQAAPRATRATFGTGAQGHP